MRFVSVVGCAIASLLAGCSAIIEPDITRLGRGTDGAVDSGTSDGGSCTAGCDDAVACTADSCSGGSCLHEPNDALCPGQICHPTIGCVPENCTADPQCDDGLFCNGDERCESGVCAPGTAPECVDTATCTIDGCDEDLDACIFAPDDTPCADAVPCTTDVCDPAASGDPSGCVRSPDDTQCSTACSIGLCDPTIGCTMGAPVACEDGDPCTSDSCAEPLGCTSAPRDVDMDGSTAATVTNPDGSTTSCPGGMDCNDANPAVFPGATEICDGMDNDCDRMADENCVPDNCAGARAITLNTNGDGSASGRFATLADDYTVNPICTPGTGGRDAVYYVDLPLGRWDVTIDTVGSNADTLLGVGLDCSVAGLQGACHDDIVGDTDSRIWLHRVGSFTGTTRIYILVDAFDSSQTGNYSLSVRRRNALPDSCPSGGGALPLDITGGGTVVGNQTDFFGSQRGSCQGAFDTSPEAIFRVNGPADGTVRFDVFSTDFSPALYLRAQPCSSGTEVACVPSTGTGATLTASATSGNLYYLFVDGGRGLYAVYYTP